MSKNKAVISAPKTLFENSIYWYVEDVVKETGLAKKTIYNLCSIGDLPCLKQRKRLVFIPDEIRKWNTPKGR